MPNLHRRYVHLFFNGVERDRLIIEDVQKPNRDVVEQWFAGEGRLTKTNPWFEYDAAGTIIMTQPGPLAITNRLETFRHGDGTPWTSRDRWTWSPTSGHDDPHDFSGIRSLIAAAQTPGDGLVDAIRSRADIRGWMRTFAHNDLCSFWDTFGNPGAKNAYLHESLETGLWSVLVWDMDVGLGVFNDPFNAALFPGNVDAAVMRMYEEPALVRDYWGALQEALGSFFDSGAGTEVNAILQETFDALTANGAAVTSPFVPSGPDGLSVDAWIGQRRTFLLGEVAGKDAAFSADGPPASPDLFVTVTGTAPLTTHLITANGIALDPDWSTITEWGAQVPLGPGANTVQLEAFDRGGAAVGAVTLDIEYTGGGTWPALRINEWMAINPAGSGILDPADGDADDWFEIYNPTASAVALGGWFLSDDPADPQRFRIPEGFAVPAGGFLMVWADGEVVQNDTALRPRLARRLPARRRRGFDRALRPRRERDRPGRFRTSDLRGGRAPLPRWRGRVRLHFDSKPGGGEPARVVRGGARGLRAGLFAGLGAGEFRNRLGRAVSGRDFRQSRRLATLGGAHRRRRKRTNPPDTSAPPRGVPS